MANGVWSKEFLEKKRKEIAQTRRELEEKHAHTMSKYDQLEEDYGFNTEPATFPYVEACRKIYNNYTEAKDKYGKDFRSLEQNFKGEELDRRIAQLKEHAPSVENSVTTIKAYSKIYLDYLNALEADAMNPAKITADYNLLSLPVTLTADELQNLRDRNCDNPLFCRALREYFSKHETEYDTGVVLDLQDSLATRRGIIENLTKELEKSIRFDNADGFERVGTDMLLDMCAENLNGNGLFKQPPLPEGWESEE